MNKIRYCEYVVLLLLFYVFFLVSYIFLLIHSINLNFYFYFFKQIFKFMVNTLR